METTLPKLLQEMSAAAAARGLSHRQWAFAAGVRPETVSRLRHRDDCDLSTLEVLARAVGLTIEAAPAPAVRAKKFAHMPAHYGREEEEQLLDLCLAREPDLERWRAAGPSFFMGGLAVMLAGVDGYDRARFLDLAEALHPGVTTAEAFAMWLEQSPVRPSRFLPLLEQWHAQAPTAPTAA